MTDITAANNRKQAITYGIIIGIIYIVLFTAINMFFLSNMFVYYGIRFLGFVVYMILLGVFAAQIKKSNGGYFDFKQTFGMIFIMIVFVNILYYIYMFIYFAYIDPHYLEKMKNSVLTFMESRGNMPQEKIDDTAKSFDKQMEEAKHFNLAKNLLSYCMSVVGDAVFGLIVALIVRKNKPVFDKMQ